jgi:hypothetical protein
MIVIRDTGSMLVHADDGGINHLQRTLRSAIS